MDTYLIFQSNKEFAQNKKKILQNLEIQKMQFLKALTN